MFSELLGSSESVYGLHSLQSGLRSRITNGDAVMRTRRLRQAPQRTDINKLGTLTAPEPRNHSIRG